MTVTEASLEELIVKSRERVKAHGEVFTPRHMVDRMLDLVRDELEAGPDFVDKTFLEPAAGDGNFLIAILRRKLIAIEKNFAPDTWIAESLFAVASIYGIELLEDNHRDAKGSLLAEFLKFHTLNGVSCGAGTRLRRSAAFLIETNIVRGDMLTGTTCRGDEIQFSWWRRLPGNRAMVQREPFTFAALRDGAFDFTSYETYRECRIDEVYKEAKADA